MPLINLQSSDGEIFPTDLQILQCSGTIKFMLVDCCMEDDVNTILPLPNVSAKILRKIISWAEYHKNDEQPLEEKPNADIIPWDAEFLNVDQGILFEIMLAANYLEIKELLELTCKTVANMFKGKTAQQIRKHFKIKKDFTRAEQKQMRQETKWFEREIE